MARPALSDEEIAAFRSRLAVVGTRLFAEQGYEGVTLRAVAAELGVSPMTPYRYVADKAELLTLVQIEAFRRFADAQEAASLGPRDPLAKLRRLARAYFRFATEEPDAYRMMELAEARSANSRLATENARGFVPLRTATAEAIAAGQLVGDPLSVAHLLWATAHGLVSLHLTGKLGGGRTFEQLTKHLISNIGKGPGAP